MDTGDYPDPVSSGPSECPADPHSFERELLRYYGRGDYSLALTITLQAVEMFPDIRSMTIFWAARLHCLLDNADAAIALLKWGTDGGLWWSDRLLSHRELTVLRQDERFLSIAAESAALGDLDRSQARPSIVVLSPGEISGATPLLFVLHGRGMKAAQFATHWQASKDENVLLALPQSSQLLARNIHCWDNEQQAKREVAAAYRRLAESYEFNAEKTIVAGYSHGADLAISIALQSDLPGCSRFLAIAPTLANPPIAHSDGETDDRLSGLLPTSSNDALGLRGWISVGEFSQFGRRCHLFKQELLRRGHLVEIRMTQGSADEFPANFPSILNSALAFLLGP